MSHDRGLHVAVYIIRGSYLTYLWQSGWGFIVCVYRSSLSRCVAFCWLHCSSPQVFLREAERQRLQALLHREVLGRIVRLQRRFRARLERKQFVRMRVAAISIQVWFRAFLSLSIYPSLMFGLSHFCSFCFGKCSWELILSVIKYWYLMVISRYDYIKFGGPYEWLQAHFSEKVTNKFVIGHTCNLLNLAQTRRGKYIT